MAVPFQSPFHSEGVPVAGDEKREGDGEGSASGNLEDDCTTAVSVAVPNHREKNKKNVADTWLMKESINTVQKRSSKHLLLLLLMLWMATVVRWILCGSLQ